MGPRSLQIYPKWSIFAQSLKRPSNSKQAYFKNQQEAVREKVEGALFGVLLARPSRLWQEECIGIILPCFVILHDIAVEHRRRNGNSSAAAGIFELYSPEKKKKKPQ